MAFTQTLFKTIPILTLLFLDLIPANPTLAAQQQVHRPHYGTEQQAKQAPLGSAEGPDVPYILRDAVIPADLDDMTTVVLETFALAPEARYIYQLRDRHPAYHRACMCLPVEQTTHPSPETFVKAISVPDPGADRSASAGGGGARRSRVVAPAMWHFVAPPKHSRRARAHAHRHFAAPLPL
ncbi:hypothetical protein DL768_010221 [Monosporascus sp. mg162]|nr:hypothetical protein DL768_010221 [Monosporascus sp. mg162]